MTTHIIHPVKVYIMYGQRQELYPSNRLTTLARDLRLVATSPRPCGRDHILALDRKTGRMAACVCMSMTEYLCNMCNNV